MVNKKDKKVVGNYKVFFKVTFDKKKDDKIFLNLNVSKDVLGLLKEVTLDEYQSVDFFGTEFKRHMVKSWLFNSLYTTNISVSKEVLFIKEFIEKGKIILPCDSTEHIDNLIIDLKNIFKNLITTILKYHDYEVVVNYSVKKTA